MLLSDQELKKYAINIESLKPQVKDKLREKAATYEDCMDVSKKLTWLVYQMTNAPIPPEPIREYLQSYFGIMQFGTTVCEICRLSLSFSLFEEAQRGRGLIETCHLNPRLHNVENIGFAHRECNIAQGGKTLDEFYLWIKGILERSNKL